MNSKQERVSDTKSTKSSNNRSKEKVCAQCGKQQDKNWGRHCDDYHDGIKQVWDGKSEIEASWCENWREFLGMVKPKPKAINIHPSFKKGFKEGNDLRIQRSKKGSVCSGSQLAIDPEEEIQKMEGIQKIQNQEVAVPQPSQPKLKPQAKSATGSMLRKRQICELDGPSEEEIKSSCDKVEAMFPSNEFKEFDVPTPLPLTVYINKHDRVIQKLQLLEKSTDPLQIKVNGLLKITPDFFYPSVCAYIERFKGNLLNINHLLLLAQQNASGLPYDDISSLALVSIIFGGATWAALPKMFGSLDADKLESVLKDFHQLLISKFDSNLATWICANWRYLEEQTLILLRFLSEEHLDINLASDIATLSRMVIVTNAPQFTSFVEVFSKFPAFKLMMDALKTQSRQWNPTFKLDFIAFTELVGFLMRSNHSMLIEANQTELIQLPLKDWQSKLSGLLTASEIINVASVQYRIDQLCKLYGPLLKCHSRDLKSSGDQRYNMTLNSVVNPPNDLQFANSQYAAFTLKDTPKQLWSVPSGQGKSRMLATLMLILLLAKSTTKIHIVFDTEHLMKRDQKEFNQWLTLNSLESFVEYHVGMYFECQPTDVILFDEADELILTKPTQFIAKIQQNKSICLTATPDNQENLGLEREVLKLMDFSMFDGSNSSEATANAVTTLSDFKMDEVLSVGACSQELLSFISKERLVRALLLYCSKEFEEFLVHNQISFLSMKDGHDISDVFLRALDKRNDQDRTHALIVASSSFGMRGFDYRAPDKGITLVIASSFDHQRQLMQGLNRVGRFNDPCKRIGIVGVPLVDKEKEWSYKSNLMSFLSQHQTNRVVALLPAPEEKKSKHKTKKVKKQKSSQTTGTTRASKSQQPKDLSLRQTKLLGGSINPNKQDKKQEDEDQNIVITPSQLL